MSRNVTQVTVNTAAGSVTYEDVANVKVTEGTLVVYLYDDAKKAKEVWFGPGFWHTMTGETEKYND